MSPRTVIFAVALALLFAPAAHASTILTLFPGNRSDCVASATQSILAQLIIPTTCQAAVACNNTIEDGRSGSQQCRDAGGIFTPGASVGRYFALSQYNGPSCANAYTGAALAQTGSCISLGLIGIPAFGLPNCPDGATGNLTMGIFGNAACTIPFTGLGTLNMAPGQCLAYNLQNAGAGAVGFSVVGQCVSLTGNASATVPFPMPAARPGAAGKTSASFLGAAAVVAGIMLLV